MTPEDIVRLVELDMKEGGTAYQPAYWQMKLLLRIKALVGNDVSSKPRVALQELVASIKALRNSTVKGVLPEASRAVDQEDVTRLEDAIKSAEAVLEVK